MRFVVFGAGAIGGVVGARLAQAGHDVALIARGEHGKRIAADGLRLLDAGGTEVLRLPVAPDPGSLGVTDDDVVLLAVKSQDTVGALDTLRAEAPGVAVACLQNGVANEREALRRFERVQSVTVMLPAGNLRPGEVAAFSSPVTGLLDVGRYPESVDDLTKALVAVFAASTFDSRAVPDLMRWKYAKLLMNLGNALQAVAGADHKSLGSYDLLHAEAVACFEAAGIDYASREEDQTRRGQIMKTADVPGQERGGGSSWQSAARGTGTIETDFLNGEIVLLGRLHGVPTPANALLQRLANDGVRRGLGPGWMDAAELTARPERSVGVALGGPVASAAMSPSHRRLIALLGATALLVASCSSSGSDGESGAKPTTSTRNASSPSTTASDGGQAGGGEAATGKPLARYADYQTKNYADAKHWVCRPENSDDICHSDLDSTSIAADGTLTVEKFKRAADPPIDCFYVYPTISRDQTTYSDWNFSPDEEGYVTQQQAARLGSQCRVFAPVYRQRTLAGLAGAIGGDDDKKPEEKGDPFADVQDAFRTYMATENHGRGFMLIGHSQGTGMLNQLIKTEIDPNADVRTKLVSAYLAGGSVAVPEGKTVGGDFKNVPLCTSDDEAGCVVTWATFRSTAPPPPNSLFGKPRGAPAGQVAGCVNPADPSGKGGSVEVHSYFPTASGSILAPDKSTDQPSRWLDAPAGTITTPFVSTPGLVTEQCASSDGFNYLEATIHPDPSGPRADDIGGDLTPEWGLHLVDVNLVMGDIVDLVAKQTKVFAAG